MVWQPIFWRKMSSTGPVLLEHRRCILARAYCCHWQLPNACTLLLPIPLPSRTSQLENSFLMVISSIGTPVLLVASHQVVGYAK